MREMDIELPRRRAIAELAVATDDAGLSAIEARIAVERAIHAAFPDETLFEHAEPETGWLLTLPGDDDEASFPAFGLSLAYFQGGSARVAAIKLVSPGEVLSAAAGLGATQAGRPLRVGEPQSKTALILGQGNDMADVATLVARLRGWRRPDSKSPVALLCALATGRIDGFVVEIDSGSRHLAASTLIARESGAEVEISGSSLIGAASSELLPSLRNQPILSNG